MNMKQNINKNMKDCANRILITLLLIIATSISAKNEIYTDKSFTVDKMINILDINIKSDTITFKDIDTGVKSQLVYLQTDENKSCKNDKLTKNSDEWQDPGFFCLTIKPLVDSQEYKLVGKKYQIIIKYSNEHESKKANNGIIVSLAQDFIPM